MVAATVKNPPKVTKSPRIPPHLQERYTKAFVLRRPKLRGYSHLLMAPVAVTLSVFLLAKNQAYAKWDMWTFSVFFIALFTVSAIYHVSKWHGKVRMWLNRIDTATITLFIVATMTPIVTNMASGALRLVSIIAAWAVCLGYSALTLTPIQLPGWVKAVAYVTIGWLVAAPLIGIGANLPVSAYVLLALGGVIYTVGAVIYATKWPNPAPRWFGYHEIFHIFVIVAAIIHYAAIYFFVA